MMHKEDCLKITKKSELRSVHDWCLILLLWLQWKKLKNLPHPCDFKGVSYSAVCCGWLYITLSCGSSNDVFIRTKNKQDWESLPPPPDTIMCHGMLSHNDRLFILSLPDSVNSHRHLSILELLKINDDLKWQKLPNARCPVKVWEPAFFGAGNSLVLAGGLSIQRRPQKCSEYDLHDNDWVTTTSWPALPHGAFGLQSVTVDNSVHLIGDGPFSPRNTIFSIDLRDGRPASDWTGSTNALPNPPLSDCGVCQVHGNVVVAGGFDVVPKPHVFVFDRRSRKWLNLPELTFARSNISLSFFGGSLLAIGGNMGHIWDRPYSIAIEELSLPSTSLWDNSHYHHYFIHCIYCTVIGEHSYRFRKEGNPSLQRFCIITVCPISAKLTISCAPLPDKFNQESKQKKFEKHSSLWHVWSLIELVRDREWVHMLWNTLEMGTDSFLLFLGQNPHNGACAHYLMVSKFQWKPFWLTTQLDLQNDWTGWQNRLNYDVIAQDPSIRSGRLFSDYWSG